MLNPNPWTKKKITGATKIGSKMTLYGGTTLNKSLEIKPNYQRTLHSQILDSSL